uniref:Sec23/Sec24 helical domain-containing protein n=2 Tax=Triticum urartu TaxID=4572 RepID=A0A8R7P8R9_TRIUA
LRRSSWAWAHRPFGRLLPLGLHAVGLFALRLQLSHGERYACCTLGDRNDHADCILSSGVAIHHLLANDVSGCIRQLRLWSQILVKCIVKQILVPLCQCWLELLLKTQSDKLDSVRQQLQLKLVRSLKEYWNLYVVQHQIGGRLIYPESLRYVPLYILAFPCSAWWLC